MRTAFLLSGFNMNQSAADPKYKELRDAIASKGYRVVPVPFHWNYTTISEYVDKFVKFYEKNKSEKNIVVGGSYNAIVSFLAAPVIQPDKVLVCSLSPYFKEDMVHQDQAYMLKRFGKRRTADYYNLSADETIKKLNEANVRMVFLVGEKENYGKYIKLRERTKGAASKVKNSKFVIVPGAPHSFRHPAYIKGILKEL